ncbi:uncharacterized protein LOC108912116, partial [Anoplophora glabripennis]|uniref:uncharacterized protein LOC108912116 n=1 Tax=Anoplophora glabripennis TaxID=217634 RepID=UPI0008756C34
MNDDYQTLVRKRASLKSKLTSFSNFTKALNDKTKKEENPGELDLIQLNERLNKITETLLSDFDEVQILLENAAENMEEQFSERDTFETNYYNQISLAKQLLKNYASDDKSEKSVSTKSSRKVKKSDDIEGIRLPEVDIPKFNGEHTRWLEFRDTFRSLIHENESIKQIQKFHYLRASLVGKAAEFLMSEEFSEASYDGALQAMLERFDNKCLLIDKHIKALFDLEPVQKESSEKIRN